MNKCFHVCAYTDLAALHGSESLQGLKIRLRSTMMCETTDHCVNWSSVFSNNNGAFASTVLTPTWHKHKQMSYWFPETFNHTAHWRYISEHRTKDCTYKTGSGGHRGHPVVTKFPYLLQEKSKLQYLIMAKRWRVSSSGARWHQR